MFLKRPSDRERAVLAAIVRFGSIARAAAALDVEVECLLLHLDQLRKRTGFHTRSQLISWAAMNGWIQEAAGD